MQRRKDRPQNGKSWRTGRTRFRVARELPLLPVTRRVTPSRTQTVRRSGGLVTGRLQAKAARDAWPKPQVAPRRQTVRHRWQNARSVHHHRGSTKLVRAGSCSRRSISCSRTIDLGEPGSPAGSGASLQPASRASSQLKSSLCTVPKWPQSPPSLGCWRAKLSQTDCGV